MARKRYTAEVDWPQVNGHGLCHTRKISAGIYAFAVA
jgi:hypothetical protein